MNLNDCVLFCAAAMTGAAAVSLAAAERAEFRLVAEVPYLAPGRSEKLDLYLPVPGGAEEKRAAVVYFHGGGWVKGDKAAERETSFGRTLAAAGYVFVSANYRLGSRAWPQNLADCRAAVRFLRSHAAEYRVDPDRIAVMGASAGAHLALMVGFSTGTTDLAAGAPDSRVSDRVRAIVSLYGMTNLLTRQHCAADGTPTGRLNDAYSPEVLGAGRAENPALWRSASPVTHVTRLAPPTLIVHGLSDAIVDYVQAVELANALRAQQVPHELVLLEGVGHQFDLESWQGQPLPRDLRGVVLAFLQRHLSGNSPAKSP